MEAIELKEFIERSDCNHSLYWDGEKYDVALFVTFIDLYEFARLIGADFQDTPYMVALKGNYIGIMMLDILEAKGIDISDVFDYEELKTN